MSLKAQMGEGNEWLPNAQFVSFSLPYMEKDLVAAKRMIAAEVKVVAMTVGL